jgi:hypothetical protein
MQALMDINGECRRQYEVFFRIFVCNLPLRLRILKILRTVNSIMLS